NGFCRGSTDSEIGIRMALGAGYARVLGQVMGQSALLTAVGIAVGVPGAPWGSRGGRSFRYGLRATDPWTYQALAVDLAAIALSALRRRSRWPARRSSRTLRQPPWIERLTPIQVRESAGAP